MCADLAKKGKGTIGLKTAKGEKPLEEEKRLAAATKKERKRQQGNTEKRP